MDEKTQDAVAEAPYPYPQPHYWEAAGILAATYDYHDKDRNIVFQVMRSKHKKFAQRKPRTIDPGFWDYDLDGVERPLPIYRLPELLAEIAMHKNIYLVEGEKCVDALRACGLCATTNPGGASNWKPGYTDILRGAKRVIILPDNDEPGRKHAAKVHASLPNSLILELPGLPPKGDVIDWGAAGSTVLDLLKLTDEAIAAIGPKDDATNVAAFGATCNSGAGHHAPPTPAELIETLGKTVIELRAQIEQMERDVKAERGAAAMREASRAVLNKLVQHEQQKASEMQRDLDAALTRASAAEKDRDEAHAALQSTQSLLEIKTQGNTSLINRLEHVEGQRDALKKQCETMHYQVASARSMWRTAWEAGIELAAMYGDNARHLRGAQADSQWAAWIAKHEGVTPAIMSMPKVDEIVRIVTTDDLPQANAIKILDLFRKRLPSVPFVVDDQAVMDRFVTVSREAHALNMAAVVEVEALRKRVEDAESENANLISDIQLMSAPHESVGHIVATLRARAETAEKERDEHKEFAAGAVASENAKHEAIAAIVGNGDSLPVLVQKLKYDLGTLMVMLETKTERCTSLINRLEHVEAERDKARAEVARLNNLDILSLQLPEGNSPFNIEDGIREWHKAYQDARDERDRAVRTLESAGYRDHGGELWAPPVGPNPSPLLERIAELEAERDTITKDWVPRPDYVRLCKDLNDMIRQRDNARAGIEQVQKSFKAFHASLCKRFGYEHDEYHWLRDLVSLEECIATQNKALQARAETVETLQARVDDLEGFCDDKDEEIAALRSHHHDAEQAFVLHGKAQGEIEALQARVDELEAERELPLDTLEEIAEKIRLAIYPKAGSIKGTGSAPAWIRYARAAVAAIRPSGRHLPFYEVAKRYDIAGEHTKTRALFNELTPEQANHIAHTVNLCVEVACNTATPEAKHAARRLGSKEILNIANDIGHKPAVFISTIELVNACIAHACDTSAITEPVAGPDPGSLIKAVRVNYGRTASNGSTTPTVLMPVYMAEEILRLRARVSELVAPLKPAPLMEPVKPVAPVGDASVDRGNTGGQS